MKLFHLLVMEFELRPLNICNKKELYFDWIIQLLFSICVFEDTGYCLRWLRNLTYLLFLYLSWIACCGELIAAQCDALKCKIKSVNLWIEKPVKRSSRADQIGRSKLRRANAIAAAEIIDGVNCKNGSASNKDNSHKYCNKYYTHTHTNIEMVD